MNDDWSLFIVVTTMLLAMIYLCTYLQNIAVLRKDWVNLKCNPIYMLANSFVVDDETAIDEFKNCINKV
jgi:hypothetical protein